MAWVVGLMSGTSLDGIDAALIDTDGETVTACGPALTVPYDDAFRARLRAVLGGHGDPAAVAAVEAELTDRHAQAVRLLLAGDAPRPELVGFHGHTIAHRPADRLTRQIGDGARLAAALGLPVVYDFRSADVAAGGQGAPLVPVYHRALYRAGGAAGWATGPLAVLNLGGVGNLTFLDGEAEPRAFDTGPGNALLDDWALAHTGQAQDTGGALAAAGRVEADALARLLAHPWFAAPPPKSLDRDDFQALAAAACTGLAPADGAATLTAFTAHSVARALSWLPRPPARWLVTGGGRHNPVLMAALAEALAAPVAPVEAVGWDGDALEAQAFAFLAARQRRGLALTFPGTTGVAAPLTGGRLAAA